ncbi:uncharacterized protein LOC129942294 [Eupeodes corollae]|uniref:uncharacterized protein LOC129942294 n=1 Tax=Eupeodes corollae TaxID=290404 RepID=UPI00248F7460|nr:uncharacterized protein LOC129942294 [Eupeodes corollae]
MIKMRPYVPSDRIAIRDSIEEDISDEVEDDVFIKDARTAKISEEKGLKRPLMAPRRKNGGKPHSSLPPIMKKHRRCWKCCKPFCYGLAALSIFIGFIMLAAFVLTMFPVPLQKIKIWLKKEPNFSLPSPVLYGDSMGTEFVPCTQISVHKIWSRTFPRINSESPMRKADLNGDDIKDIIFGYGVDDNIQYDEISLPKCKSVQQGDIEDVPCEGGVIALDGANGNLLWQTWSIGNVFSLYCTVDIDKDGFIDCIASGRLGMIFAINGRNGNKLWDFKETQIETNSPVVIDLYTINSVRDLDGDETPEVLAVHVEERATSRSGHIKLISGRTGKVIRVIPTPYREEAFVPIQIVTQQDGTEVLMIITGGQNTPGGVYSIRLLNLMQYTSEKEFISLYRTNSSGFMAPAILTDLTGDLINDIIVSSFNSTIYAFDGKTFKMLWNFTFPASESVSAIVPGHFNHDNVTDFMIKYNTGPGFPVYYYSQTTILDGITGKPLLDAMMTDSGGASSLLGGMSISQTFGGDFFLHWQTQCRNKYGAKDAYEFIPGSDIILQARADTCVLRYNESTVLKLYAIARHIEPPGAVIFSTDDLELKLNRTQSSQTIKKDKSKSPLKHPKMLNKLMKNNDQPFVEGQQLKPEEKLINSATVIKPILNTLKPLEDKAESIPIFGSRRNYQYLPYQSNNPRDFKDYEADPSRSQEEYQEVYVDEGIPNDRPIRLRSKYPGNRDVRSEFISLEVSPNDTVPNIAQNSLEKEEPLSLWDLEVEKEEQDVLKERNKYEYPPNNDNSQRKQRDDDSQIEKDDDAQYLASISSSGVLLKSLDNSPTSIDYAFLLNIRESETYPPLFLPQDWNCMEEKISAYRSYTAENLSVLEKQFLKQCLSGRSINSLTPTVPRYESQMVISRITLTCTCRSLEKGEVCSELDDIKRQRWTEFMGNNGDGSYKN